jgi:predicted outer membrane protein
MKTMKILRLLPSMTATMMLIVGACFVVNGQADTMKRHAGAKMQGDAGFISRSIRDNRMEVRMAQMAIDKSDNQKIKSLAQQMVKDHTKMLEDLQKLQGARGDRSMDRDMNDNMDRNNAIADSGLSEPGDTGTASNQLDIAGRKTSKDEDTSGRDTAMAGMTGQPNSDTATMRHDGMGRDHMRGDREALMNATGKEFDDMWVSLMLEMHNRKLDELKSASSALTDPKLKALVKQAIPKVQSHRDQLSSLSKNTGTK